MKKSLCFYFQIHLPYQLRRYRFFDIGATHQYYDEFNTRSTLQKISTQCYLPMNKILLDLIKEHGDQFKIAFSITGETIEQMKEYTPHVLDSFKELADTGNVEFLCTTYSNSIAFLKNETELEVQLQKECNIIKKYLGQTPTIVSLSNLIYSDQLGETIGRLGFNGIITEGAKHILGWKSPNYVYTNANNNKLKVLLRNYQFSDDITYKFSDTNSDLWPITAEKYTKWLNEIDEKEDVVNVFLDYMTFGVRHDSSTGIFDFMRYLPKQIIENSKYEFAKPSEAISKHKAVAPVHVPYPISNSDEERDLSLWLGNDLQSDAFDSLCDLRDKVYFADNEFITKDWEKLQDSIHFYFMSTKWLTDNFIKRFDNIYSSPYDAYINYMNVLSDLTSRVNQSVKLKVESLLKNNVYTNKISTIITSQYENFTSLQVRKISELLNAEAIS